MELCQDIRKSLSPKAFQYQLNKITMESIVRGSCRIQHHFNGSVNWCHLSCKGRLETHHI